MYYTSSEIAEILYFRYLISNPRNILRETVLALIKNSAFLLKSSPLKLQISPFLSIKDPKRNPGKISSLLTTTS